MHNRHPCLIFFPMPEMKKVLRKIEKANVWWIYLHEPPIFPALQIFFLHVSSLQSPSSPRKMLQRKNRSSLCIPKVEVEEIKVIDRFNGLNITIMIVSGSGFSSDVFIFIGASISWMKGSLINKLVWSRICILLTSILLIYSFWWEIMCTGHLWGICYRKHDNPDSSRWVSYAIDVQAGVLQESMEPTCFNMSNLQGLPMFYLWFTYVYLWWMANAC